MKTALYIEDGMLQVVLTPQTDQEKAILSLVEKKHLTRLYRGSFYACQGGWMRQQALTYGFYGEADHSDKSLILVLEEPTPTADPPFDPPTP